MNARLSRGFKQRRDRDPQEVDITVHWGSQRENPREWLVRVYAMFKLQNNEEKRYTQELTLLPETAIELGKELIEMAEDAMLYRDNRAEYDRRNEERSHAITRSITGRK